MKTKTLFLILCSVFMTCGCGQDSSLFSFGGDAIKCTGDVTNGESLVYSISSSGPKYILYYVSFDRNTGWFTLYYLPSDVYSWAFGDSMGGETGTGEQSDKGGSGEILQPLPSETTPPSRQTLNYKLDIYVSKDNKINYPPVFLPFYSNRYSSGTFPPLNISIKQREQFFDRNQYSDILKNADDFTVLQSTTGDYDMAEYLDDGVLKYVIMDNSTENSVFYTIKDDKMYFHIDPASSIFTDDVSEIDMGIFHIVTYTTEWASPVHSGSYILPVVNYDINVALRIIKGDPPVESESDDELILPVDRLYNIFVYESCITVIPLNNVNNGTFLKGTQEFPNSAYYINQDGTISILNSKGIQIAKYPSNYTLSVRKEECNVM